MEILIAFVGSLATESTRLLWGSIHSCIKFNSNLIALNQKIATLVDLGNEVKEEIQLAEEEGGLLTQMKEWLHKVEELHLEVNSMQADVTSNRCSICFNCRLSRKVKKKLEEVQALLDAYSSLVRRVAVNDKVTAVEYIPGPSIENQITASKKLTEIMELLNDDGVRKIGIWGMGGVGKTALIKNMNNKLKRDSLNQPFDVVIWVTVSKELDLKKVQTQIAERLKLKLNMEESVGSIAHRLYRRLQKQNKFLLILDDVWQTIDLDTLGVPQPEVHEGSKIILTSRSLDVYREMKVDEHVRMDVLSDEESWHLFSENAGMVVSSEHIKPIAEEVSRECCGLPLAIITVGTAMRGKAMVELWNDALNELRRSEPNISGIETRLYKPLKWSYDLLQGKNIKPCFLYCSLFPEDFSIEVSELVQYWKAEGLLDEGRNYYDSINRGIAIVQDLMESCLLEHGLREGTVKMHDVVRDVAVWIASTLNDGCRFFIRSGIGLSQISNSDMELFTSSHRVSFMNNKITALPDSVIPSPTTSTLLLQGNTPLDQIPEQFLVRFQVLSVLSLGATKIQSLPTSLTQLGQLRALFLRDCSYLEELPPLGGLRKLQQLDLCGTRIRELSEEVGKLSNLRQLNLSRTRNLKTIRAGLVSMLSSLEVLDMTESAYMWGVRRDEETIFEELVHLNHLVSVCIWVESLPYINYEDSIWMLKLKRFQIIIGSDAHANYLPTKYDERKLVLCDLDLSEKQIGWLLCNASSLVLNSCIELDWMLEYLFKNTFNALKSLTIVSCHGLRSFRRHSDRDAPHVPLPSLEEFYIHHLNEKEFVQLLAMLGKSHRLRSIEVSHCSELIFLFPLCFPCLGKLEEIKISSCNKLKWLFGHQGSGGKDTPMPRNENQGPLVPNLRILQLENLPRLSTISCETESWMSLEQLRVSGCDGLSWLPLTTLNVRTIKEIRGEREWWTKLQWGDEDTKLSLLPFFKPS